MPATLTPTIAADCSVATAPQLHLARVRAQIVRHRELAECVRLLTRLLEMNTLLDRTAGKPLKAGVQFDRQLDRLVSRMEKEGTLLMLEEARAWRRSRKGQR